MKKNIILLLMIMMVIPVLVRAEWIPLNKNNSGQSLPIVTIVSNDNNSTVFKIEISGFDLKEFVSEDKTYQFADLLSESFTIKPSFPKVPYISKVLAIPDQANISFEVLDTGEMQTFDNIHLPPAKESWIEGYPESSYIENARAYNSIGTYPSDYVRLESPAIFRDFRIARVSVYPLRYIPAKKQLQVVSSIIVRINYISGKTTNPKTTAKKQIAPSFGELYRSFIFNYQSVLDKLYDGKEEGHELMLCIMPDDFYDSFQSYADWKRESGIDIHITKFSDIGANSNDESIIKNHIVDAYYNWEVPPTYVLLVGDEGIFPVYNYGNENYFGEIEGNDYFPELMVGRLTNQSDYSLQVMLNKFQLYEETPFTAETDWFMKGTCCSNDAYASQIGTKRFAAQQMMEYGEFLSVDTMMGDPGCTYNVSDVITAINEGRSFLNYRGEGWSNGWWATCTPLNISYLSSINNGQKLTFVTSIGCGVAMFNSGHCFGEEWMEMGTISSPKGGVAFIGPAGNTHTTYNNKIDKGIYVGMFQEGMETPGQAQLRGKLYMYNVFGDTPSVEYHYRIYCILGDPSIHIWKDVPQNVSVEHPSSIPFGLNTVEVTVTHTSNGLPVENALVCISDNDIFSTGYTDGLGKAYVEVEAEEPKILTVTVRGGNVIPFQDELIVIQPSGSYVIKESYSINDAIGGNNNGLMDYGETNLLSLTMKNVGVNQADDVVVTINSDSPYLTVTDNTAEYGDIPPGEISEVIDGFAYVVANNIPDLEIVSIEITASSGSDSWTSFISIEAHAPILEFVDYEISDPAGNNNGKFDPGETVDIIVHVENSGSSESMNILGDLSINNPYVTLNNLQASFGNIAGGSQANASYSSTADINTPAGYLAEFILSLNADLGISGTGEFNIVVGQVPVLILDLDENGNSAPGMEEAMNTMGLTYEVLNSFPPDLNLYATIFACLGIYGNNHVLSSSEGQILADYLNSGGSLYMEGGDTWYWDPDTPVHAMFNISATSDGSGDMGTIIGQNGTFTHGMSFTYNGENGWMDHIEPISPAIKVFDNQSPLYGTGVAYDAGDYKTIGTSHEFGGLLDGQSPSTKEELMTTYLDFLGIIVSLHASFSSNTTLICENESVDFLDLSSGDVTSWQWEFEGGSPDSSAEQNPSVLYSTPGSYNVTLTVSDGTENNTIIFEDYITVESMPDLAPTPTGPTIVCATDESSTYYTTGLPGISNYSWLIDPGEAGYIANYGLHADIFWINGYVGEVTLKVAAENACGTGEYSDPINITRYLPEVTLEPFNWVCFDWPAFELTGGIPEGGVYSGAGVENGWFDPGIAGVGSHTITYTYIDTNSCENFAMETILVDPCTGLNDITNDSEIKIYPNPSTGIVNIKFEKNLGNTEIAIVNTLNKVVYTELTKTNSQKEINIDLSNQAKGIYLIIFKTDNSEERLKLILK